MSTYTPELADLMEHERVIEQGLTTFIDVGNALVAIRDGKKYRAAGHNTFEDYCQKRWQLSRNYATRLMNAAATFEALEETVPIGTVLPTAEGQIRPLARLRDDPDEMRAAWAEAVERADGNVPTEAIVREVVAERVPPVVQPVRPPVAPVAPPRPVQQPPAPPRPTPPPIRPEVIAPPPPPRQTVQPVSRPPVIKPDLGRGISHPARYSDELLPVFADLLEPRSHVLDPFAGTGKIHQLQQHGHTTVGIEIEPEWANLHPDTITGSALELPFDDRTFDAIVTSPTYGNRFADSHNASDPHLRRSYTHDLGRQLNDDNSGSLQWGDAYRTFHKRAWAEAVRVLRADGLFVLNIKDHIRGGRWVDVAGWHVGELTDLGLNVEAIRPVVTGHLRQGANSELRVPAELVIALRKVKP